MQNYHYVITSSSLRVDYYSILCACLCVQVLDSGLSWREELEGALKALAHLLRDEKTISAYEVHHSRLIPVLLYCLTGGLGETASVGTTSETKMTMVYVGDKAIERVNIFKRMFSSTLEDSYSDLDAR